jgi:alkylation response protein AidB-like acyl-CoA dehydrogenase
MTFELSPQHTAVRDRARGLAQMVAAKAAEIDGGYSPTEFAGELVSIGGSDPLGLVLAAEEVATASAAVAVASLATKSARALTFSGLRGACEIEGTPREQLVLAAVALGIGTAAVDAALGELRRSTATPGADVEKPHWVVADVATELNAARLLVYKAAHTSDDADIALARLMASEAAGRAVDAAVRVIGAAALESGHRVERLTRDVKALSVLVGTEEDQRAMAADRLLPL